MGGRGVAPPLFVVCKNAKYLGTILKICCVLNTTTPPPINERLDRIEHKRPKRKIFCISELYAQCDANVREGRGVYYPTDDVGQGGSKKQFLARHI